MRPEHFDVLGILSFTYITAFALWAYLTDINAPDWSLALLAFIGVVGLFIDGHIVFKYVLKKKK